MVMWEGYGGNSLNESTANARKCKNSLLRSRLRAEVGAHWIFLSVWTHPFAELANKPGRGISWESMSKFRYA